jgi:hypothetical protein
MEGDEEEELLEAKRICTKCVGEPYLKALIQRQGKLGTCSYCGATGARGFTVAQVVDEIEAAFENHYYRTSDQPDFEEDAAIRYGYSEFQRSGLPTSEAIQQAAMIDAIPADEITEILSDRHYDLELAKMGEESDFDASAHYAPLEVQDDGLIQEVWKRFERVVKSEARYFSRAAAATLAGVFDGVCDLRTKAGASVVRLAGPGHPLASLYRARVLQSRETLEEALMRPDIQVGPPASHLARAGRMNARGVPVFYGATQWEVALAEVRPPVGSDVVIASFEILRPLRLLDVHALQDVFVTGSVFDPTLADRARRAQFLKKLSRRIVAPVMPDVEEAEYLATQAMAEFLADSSDLDLDGIYFPSVQRRSKGANVVLFHKASRTQLLDIPKDAEIEAFLQTGYGEDPEPAVWHVVEVTPNPEDAPVAPARPHSPWQGLEFETWKESDEDERVLSLKVDVSSIVVRHIEAVSFRSSLVPVSRSRRVALSKREEADQPF